MKLLFTRLMRESILPGILKLQISMSTYGQDWQNLLRQSKRITNWPFGLRQQKEYTSTILSGLPFSENDCEFVWTRQDCDFRASECGATLPIKNLAKIRASYPDATTVMIDDKPEFVVFDIEKVIPVKPFYGNQNDQELEIVLAALLSLID